MFKALMDYTLHAQPIPGTRPATAAASPSAKARSAGCSMSSSARTRSAPTSRSRSASVGSLLDHTGPIAAGERNAARIFGSDETLFVVGGTSTANKIVWHGTVARGDLVLCDRNCHKSILHSLVMTGATPIYLDPVAQRARHHRPDLARPVHAAIDPARRSPPAPSPSRTSGKVRLMVMTNSTYDGLCYNVDAIKKSLGEVSRSPAFRRGLVRLRQLPRVL